MNLSQLQYFKTLAKEEHYTRAAQILSITQPSLSHAIAQLEQELGTRLFEKKGRNVVLTRYGKIFLPYVEESLKVLEEGVQRTKELNGSKEGMIHLAYIYTLGSTFVPKMVRRFLDAYPDYHIEFHFIVGTTGDILEGLKSDRYDMVFSSYQDGEPDIEFRQIGDQKLVLAVPKNHPLAMYDTVEKVFARAPELLELGLSVPQVTKIFLKLREMGVDVPADVYTIPYAVKMILEAKRRRDAGESLVLPREAKQKGGAAGC